MKVFLICSASPARRTPLSTKMAVMRSPMALSMRADTTAESTPPDMPQITLPVPTLFLIAPMDSSMKPFMVQPPLQPAMPKRKFPRMSFPLGVWTTSGWNWTP